MTQQAPAALFCPTNESVPLKLCQQQCTKQITGKWRICRHYAVWKPGQVCQESRDEARPALLWTENMFGLIGKTPSVWPVVAGSPLMESCRGFQIYSTINGLSAICLWAFLYSKHTDERSCPHAPGASADWMCSTDGEWGDQRRGLGDSTRSNIMEIWPHFPLHNSEREHIKHPAAIDAMSAVRTMKLI